MHTHHILFIAILSALLSLVALSPSKTFAQDSIDELVTNKNADGYKRSSKTGRVFAELGMGTVGLVTAAAPSALVFLGSAIFFSDAGMIAGIGVFELIVTPITAELVYQGGRLTGGRARHWAAYAGGYAGMATGLALGTIGFTFDAGIEGYLIVAGIAVPILSLVGSIVGYELSEKKETNRLKSDRDKLVQSQSQQRSAPIMITLYSGTF